MITILEYNIAIYCALYTAYATIIILYAVHTTILILNIQLSYYTLFIEV